MSVNRKTQRRALDPAGLGPQVLVPSTVLTNPCSYCLGHCRCRFACLFSFTLSWLAELKPLPEEEAIEAEKAQSQTLLCKRRAAIHSLSLPLTSPHEFQLTVTCAVGKKVCPDPRISDWKEGREV